MCVTRLCPAGGSWFYSGLAMRETQREMRLMTARTGEISAAQLPWQMQWAGWMAAARSAPAEKVRHGCVDHGWAYTQHKTYSSQVSEIYL